MGLINSEGRYLEIVEINNTNVTVNVYSSKAKFDAGLDPNFEKALSTNFHCGVELPDTLKATTASGTGGRSIYTNMLNASEALIVAQATENPERYKIGAILGDWTIWAAA